MLTEFAAKPVVSVFLSGAIASNSSINTNEINFSRLENFPLDVWQKDLDVSLKGTFLCIKYYGFLISKNENGGSIVNISSDLGLIAPDQRLYQIDGLEENLQPVKPITYSVVKTGVIGITRYVSTYWANKNVRCNALCLGAVQKDMSKNFINNIKKLIPLNRMANPKDYLGILLFLCDDRSSYANGATFVIDGGRTIW